MKPVTMFMCTASAILAILFNVLVLENIYILLIRRYFLYGKVFDFDMFGENIDMHEVTESAEIQRDYLCRRFGCIGLRKYFFKSYYAQMTFSDVMVVVLLIIMYFVIISFFCWLQREAARELERLKFYKLIPDVCTFILYMAMLFIIIVVNRDEHDFYSNNEIKNMVVFGEHSHSMSIFQVYNIKG